MRRAYGLLFTLYLTFITFMFFIPGEGILGTVTYYLAFILPTAVGLIYIIKNKELCAAVPLRPYVTPSHIPLLAATVAPSILLILTAATVSTLLCRAMGIDPPSSATEPFGTAILLHAAIPAVLEELLFRYLPLRILSHTSPRRAVLISAICFAFAHASPYQIPYALVAGVIFAVLDLSFLSILPSIIIHFLNNTLSLTLTYGYLSGVPKSLLYTISASVVAVSVLYIAYRSGDKIKSFMGRR